MDIIVNLMQKVSLVDSFSVGDGGFLRTSGQIARPGSQEYMISELGIGDEAMDSLAKSLKRTIYDSVEIVRSKEEVLKSVPLFQGMPFVDGHPFDSMGNIIDLTPDNYREYTKGTVYNPTGDEDGNIQADVTVWDAVLMGKIRGGQTQLSAHYKTRLGLSDDGMTMVQRDIVPNNVASVQNARCGPACSLRSNVGDSKEVNKIWMF